MFQLTLLTENFGYLKQGHGPSYRNVWKQVAIASLAYFFLKWISAIVFLWLLFGEGKAWNRNMETGIALEEPDKLLDSANSAYEIFFCLIFLFFDTGLLCLTALAVLEFPL